MDKKRTDKLGKKIDEKRALLYQQRNEIENITYAKPDSNVFVEKQSEQTG